MGDEAGIVQRISKDIDGFYDNLVKLEAGSAPGLKAARVVELAKMYASDAKSYLDRGDTHTAFSCISYAHGLLDAVREML